MYTGGLKDGIFNITTPVTCLGWRIGLSNVRFDVREGGWFFELHRTTSPGKRVRGVRQEAQEAQQTFSLPVDRVAKY